ncbi:unnamed protein product [Sphagnum jensenii]|uniref:Serine protease n=1 Tax=Sphagnum jensenii TaxID=128206 RepID=A0ABP0V5L1_9BRYO
MGIKRGDQYLTIIIVYYIVPSRYGSFDKHILFAFAITAQLSLWGCAQQDSSNTRNISEAMPHYLDSMSADRGKQTAMSGEVKCASGTGDADCSPSVAMFVSYTPGVDLSSSQVGQCSNSSPSQSGVKALADYAIIKLDQAVSRPPLTINRDGFKDQNLYQMIKIDPLSTSAAIGSMTRTDCKAQHDSKMVPNSDDNLSPDMGMGDCLIVHGNSGSPLVDMQGQVHGLIQLTFEQNTLSAMFLQLSLPWLKIRSDP